MGLFASREERKNNKIARRVEESATGFIKNLSPSQNVVDYSVSVQGDSLVVVMGVSQGYQNPQQIVNEARSKLKNSLETAGINFPDDNSPFASHSLEYRFKGQYHSTRALSFPISQNGGLEKVAETLDSAQTKATQFCDQVTSSRKSAERALGR